MPDKPAEFAIIVAGGSGSRMKRQIPKQFIAVGGQPILMHTIRRFHTYNPAITLIVILPPDQLSLWKSLCFTHGFDVNHGVVAGGASRFQSVKNGLAVIHAADGVVAVHDGVRPFASVDIIAEAFTVASEKGNAVVAVPLKESIRQLNGPTSKALNREEYRLVQTPQCFQLSLLRRAYEQPEQPTFTDDASVVESLGEEIYLVPGSYDNIKITTPDDLLWAESFFRR